MKAKRRSPVTGPLVTFALMIGTIGLVIAAAHYLDSGKSSDPTVAASASAPSSSTVRQ